MSGPIAHASVPDLVFERLRDLILGGGYGPGERLPTQRTLAADLGVNMASVREALGRLEQLRLVEVRHGDATRVRDWRRDGGLEALAVLGASDASTIAALFEARRLLLAEAARLAAERRTDDQASALLQLATGFESAPDLGSALSADWEFMATVVEAAGNLVFQLIMNSVRELYLPHAELFAGIVADRERLGPLYRGAAAAIRDRRGAAAARVIAELAAAQEASMAVGG
jgi:DNA-binding FadR family transcriptional regulator